ncbi:twin-arginine translocase subunit TatC [Panacagrimonas sp.]|uniref:twin-arginine translocase subunit TatC n=1 Tax=Panacagrimonas sp. TaxID=2480088 RepID=UPI003B5241BE
MSDTPPENSAPEQPLIAHLLELRDCVVRIIYGVGLAFIPLAYFAKEIYAFAAKPLMTLLPAGTSMIATEVASPFFAPIKLAGVLAVAISIPWTLYQMWSFVAPGLYKTERRLVAPVLISSSLLFYLGMAMAYFLVLPTVFHFLISVAPEGVAVMTDINKYLNFILSIFLAFGLAFETPVAIVLMVKTGFVTPQQLKDKREYVLVGVFVIAAVLTPPDVLSQILLAVPTYLLYELGILVAQWTTPEAREVEAQAKVAERD